MKKYFLLIVVFCALLSLKALSLPAYSDSTCDLSNLDCVNQQIDKLSQELSQSQQATAPLQSQVQDLTSQLNGIENQIAGVENDIATKKKNISDGYAQLAKQQDIFNAAVRNYYIQSSYYNPLLVLFSSADASYVTSIIGYQQHQANVDKSIITDTAIKITELKDLKTKLQAEETGLAAANAKLATQKASLQKIINGALAYQSSLTSQIAQLSALQQQLLAQKYATLGIPTTAYTSNSGCSSDLTNGRNPGFSPAFGFFTYGVYHRVGMNQYGAKGRADSGQSYQQILSFYYPNTTLTSVNTGVPITVNGTNDYGETFNNQQFGSVEDYLDHIYEMPSGWSAQALEAQAVAARTYAMKAIDSGQTTVAPNQSFQEVKTELNAQAWIDAVNATKGQILESGGQPITAWFSSTGGGYTHNSGDVFGTSTNYTVTAPDTNGSVNSFSDLQNNAYDGPHYANSPWFYCDWGSRSQYNGTAWLQSSEVADIVNVIMLAQADPSTAPHLSQTDGNIPDTWSADQVKQELKNRGITPYNSISSVSVTPDFKAGKVTSVTVNGDAGTKSFSGDVFVTYFDVRAPANIFIPSLRKNSDGSYVAPLFNVETH